MPPIPVRFVRRPPSVSQHPADSASARPTFSRHPPPISRLLLPFPFLLAPASAFALTLLAGCVNVPPVPVINYTGDPVVDGKAQLAVAPAKDQLLWQYRVAAAALRHGQDAEAAAQLDAARAATAGALAVSSPEAANARGTFHSESEKPFIGEPYERAMADFYRAILYWRAGDPDNARALYRDTELIDSDTAEKTYAGDWVLPDWLDGYVTAKLGGDGTDALARARKHSAHPLPDYDPAANVLLFVEFGRGPRKTAGGEYGEQLRFTAEPSRAASARLQVAGQTVELPPWDDVSWQARTRGGRVMDYILGNKAVFKKGADTVGDVALAGAVVAAGASRREVRRTVTGPDGKQHVVTEVQRDRGTEQAAVALGVVGLLAKITAGAAHPAADTRTWDNLPQYLSFAALRLPPGAHPAMLTFYDAAGQPLASRTQNFTVTIPAPDATTVGDAGHPRDTILFRSEVPD
ncbi:MAG: hypothetical protein WCL04_03260 [Verrucomicrobiota bacterium]